MAPDDSSDDSKGAAPSAPTSADVVEAALATAIIEATKASQWAVVAQLAKELEARRLARADVVQLDAERAKRERGR